MGQSDKLAAGHETCGVVAELGEGVTRFKVGDKATAECFSHCGEYLYCQKGHYNHCRAKEWISHEAHGGFAEYTILHESGLFKLPDHMSFEDGTLVEPLAVSHRAVARANLTVRDTVAIIGGGTIGQLCLVDSIAVGAKETLITVKYDQQVELA